MKVAYIICFFVITILFIIPQSFAKEQAHQRRHIDSFRYYVGQRYYNRSKFITTTPSSIVIAPSGKQGHQKRHIDNFRYYVGHRYYNRSKFITTCGGE